MKETRTVLGHVRDQRDPYARHPIMTPDMIRQLPARYALIVRGGTSPVIAHLPMAWTDRAYRRVRRTRRSAGLRASGERAAQAPGMLARRSPWPAEEAWPDAIPPSASWDDPGRYPWQ